ncbi:hypothetical protein KQI84_12745 [bacterium]|nr:hypothetical protein [bacterium]
MVRVQFFDYPVPDLSRLFELEDRLEAAISDAGEGIGELDGDEIALDGSDGYLFFYGSDARRLFETIRPELEASDLMRGAIIMLRFGGPEDEDVRIDTFKLPS